MMNASSFANANIRKGKWLKMLIIAKANSIALLIGVDTGTMPSTCVTIEKAIRLMLKKTAKNSEFAIRNAVVARQTH